MPRPFDNEPKQAPPHAHPWAPPFGYGRTAAPPPLPVRTLPATRTWRFVVLLDKAQVSQEPARSMPDSAALERMTALARQWAYAPETQGKGKTVYVIGVRNSGRGFESFETSALVAHQG